MKESQRISERISAAVDSLLFDSEEETRFYHFLAFLLLGVPILLGFGVYNLVKANWTMSIVVLAMAVSLVLAWVLLRKSGKGIWVYRTNTFFFGMVLLFAAANGGAEGSKSLWLLLFPLVTFFLLSSLEGLAWTVAVSIGIAGIYLVPRLGFPSHRYGGEFITRFYAVFLVISAVAWWFQYLRQHYRKGMEFEQRRLVEERAALQEALGRVKLLSGLLPICASCKKVRDDQGYWTQIEAYIRNHSEAEFSHGICPDCKDKWFPPNDRKSKE